MAKLIGPLFSQEARGAFARSIVFNRRRGQNIARSYVVPANPQTANQIAQRIRLAVGGLITRAVRATDWTYAGQMQTWIEFWRGEVREGEVWNAAMVGAMMGPGNATYIARLAQYEALDANVQALWVAEAAKAPAGLVDYTRGDVTISNGFMLFLAQYATATAGYGDAFNPDMPFSVVAG